MDGYKHYIRTNEAGIVVHGFSDAFEQTEEGDILVLEDGPRHFHLAWPESLTNERGQFLFKWLSGKLVSRTPEELDAEWAARPHQPKTEVEQLQEIVSTQQIQIDDLTLALADLYANGGMPI